MWRGVTVVNTLRDNLTFIVSVSFIYSNPSALADQGCQQSLYNKDNKQVEPM